MIQLPETETSLWRESYIDAHYPRLEKDIEVDVAIVGAGITGLTSAYLLKKTGLSVAVLDKDTVGGGTTGRTTGKVTAQHNLIYAKLMKNSGEQVAQAYADANAAALEQVQKIITDEKIECDWKREDNYVYTLDASQRNTFEKEAAAAKKLGLPAEFVTETPLPFAVKGAVKFTNQAKFNAQKYLLGLARVVHGEGSYIFDDSNVIGIRDGSPTRVKTTHGSVKAKHVIVATNVPTLPLMARGGYCVLEYPNESYLIAAELPKAQVGMYISPDKRQYSVLPIDVSGKRMILVGGEGHLSGLRGSKKRHYQRLADFAEAHFGVKEIMHMWSDRDYLAYDDIPLVGKLYKWSDHVYVGTAFMKWGMTSGTAAAMMLTDAICGIQNPWAFAFDSTRLRKPIASIPRAVVKEFQKILP